MATKRPPVDAMAFTIDEASRLSGLRTERLRDWSRDLYKPHWQSGFYTFRDLVALRTLAVLRKQGVSKPELVKAGRFLHSKYDAPWQKLRFGIGPKNRIYFADPKTGRWLSADAGQQSITPVALDHIPDEVQRAVAQARQRPPETLGEFRKDRGICGNRLRIAGTRITVEAVENLMRDGLTNSQVLREFPTLSPVDVVAVRKQLAVA